jgi:hypothetical protein
VCPGLKRQASPSLRVSKLTLHTLSRRSYIALNFCESRKLGEKSLFTLTRLNHKALLTTFPFLGLGRQMNSVIGTLTQIRRQLNQIPRRLDKSTLEKCLCRSSHIEKIRREMMTRSRSVSMLTKRVATRTISAR